MTAVRTHVHLVLPEKNGIQSKVRDTKFVDHESFQSKAQDGRSFGNPKTLSLGGTFTGNGVNWSSSIWGNASTTAIQKDLGSVGCETLMAKGHRDQPNVMMPSGPWNKKPSAWTSPEAAPLPSTTGSVFHSTTFVPHESKLTSTLTFPRLQPEPRAKNSVVPKLEQTRPSIAQNGNTNGTTSSSSRVHSQSSNPANEHALGHPLHPFVPERPFNNGCYDEWEEVTASDLLPLSLEPRYAGSQAAQTFMRANAPSFRKDIPTTGQLLAPSSWPQESPILRLSDAEWCIRDENVRHNVHITDTRDRAMYNDSQHYGLPHKYEQNRIKNIGQMPLEVVKRMPEPRGILSDQMSQSALTSERASGIPQTTSPMQASSWTNGSYTWQSQQRLPFPDQSHIPRSFQLQQQHGQDFVSMESRNRVSDTENILNAATYSGNSLTRYRNNSDYTPQSITSSHARGNELMISFLEQQHNKHQQMQRGMVYQMPGPYPYSLGFGYNDASVTNYPPYLPFSHLILQPRPPLLGLVPHADAENGLRSALLHEFRNNTKGNRRFELRDIYDHAVEFSGDQQGARFIQTKLETANSAEKDRIFREISRDAIPLTKDIFGNWVIQKFFEYGDQNQKRILLSKMEGQVLDLTTHRYGCRVVQRALDHALVDEKIRLVKELEHHVLPCVKDAHGNHVIQKALKLLPTEYTQFIFDALVGHIQHLSTHISGCRVVQRLLERSHGSQKSKILQELHVCTSALSTDRYGNYVVQSALEHSETAEDRLKLNAIVKAHLVLYSKQKNASNVVEASLRFGTNEFRREIMHLLTAKNERGESEFMGLLKDQYGNYVIQTLQKTLSPENEVLFNELLKPDVDSAGQGPASYKQAHNLAKKMQKFDNLFHDSQQMQIGPRLKAMDSSARSTPPLVMDDIQSAFCSSLSSVVGDDLSPYLKAEFQAHTIPSDMTIEITHP